MATGTLYTFTLKNGQTYKVRADSASAAKKMADSYAKEMKTAVSGSSSTSSSSSTTPAPRTVTVPAAPSATSNKKVVGGYNGENIYAGTDAEIQAQMAAIDARRGGTPTPSAPSSAAPDTAGIYDSVIKSNPVVADMLKDPKTKAQYDALTPDLQGIFLQTASSLGKAIEAGKVVNPNIVLTPAENQKLLDQATSELDPYYQEQLGFLSNDFKTSIGRLMEDYNTSTAREGDKFKQTLDSNAEAEAGAGTTYSSGRVDRENRTVTTEQQALDDAALALTRNVENKATPYEQTVGSSAVRSLNLPSLNTFTASNTGLSTGGSRSIYTPLGNVKYGSAQNAQDALVKNRQSELEKSFRANRLLDLTKLQ